MSGFRDNNLMPPPEGYHAHSGWYFERKDNGDVAITYAPNGGLPKQYVRFDRDTWASIVASVSADGENGRTFAAASVLHNERTKP